MIKKVNIENNPLNDLNHTNGCYSSVITYKVKRQLVYVQIDTRISSTQDYVTFTYEFTNLSVSRSCNRRQQALKPVVMVSRKVDT